MADERTIFVGDLGTDQLGKQIALTINGANIRDELKAVLHTRQALQSTPHVIGNDPVSYLLFANVRIQQRFDIAQRWPEFLPREFVEVSGIDQAQVLP